MAASPCAAVLQRCCSQWSLCAWRQRRQRICACGRQQRASLPSRSADPLLPPRISLSHGMECFTACTGRPVPFYQVGGGSARHGSVAPE